MTQLIATVTNPDGKDVQVEVLQFIVWKDKVCAIVLSDGEFAITTADDFRNVTKVP